MDGLDLDMSPFNMFDSIRYTCLPNMKSLTVLVQTLWPMLKMTLYDDLDLDMSPLHMCGSIIYMCMPNMKSLSLIVQHLLILTCIFDL